MTEVERARVVDSLPADPGWEVASSTLSRLSAVERELEEERAARERETAAREQAEARVAVLEREIAELRKR